MKNIYQKYIYQERHVTNKLLTIITICHDIILNGFIITRDHLAHNEYWYGIKKVTFHDCIRQTIKFGSVMDEITIWWKKQLLKFKSGFRLRITFPFLVQLEQFVGCVHLVYVPGKKKDMKIRRWSVIPYQITVHQKPVDMNFRNNEQISYRISSYKRPWHVKCKTFQTRKPKADLCTYV